MATQHCQVTGGFMWGLFASCGLFYCFGMLKEIHVYFKFCVLIVSTDDMCSFKNVL